MHSACMNSFSFSLGAQCFLSDIGFQMLLLRSVTEFSTEFSIKLSNVTVTHHSGSYLAPPKRVALRCQVLNMQIFVLYGDS